MINKLKIPSLVGGRLILNQMDKKGISGGAVLVGVLLLGVILAGSVIYFGVTSQQAITAPSGSTQTVIEQTTGGDVASLNAFAYDRVNEDQSTKVAVPIYCSDNSGDGLIIDGTNLGTSSRQTVNTVTRAKGQCIAFNTRYYGDWKGFEMVNSQGTAVEKKDIDLDVYRIANTSEIKVYSKDGLTTTSSSNANYTVNITVEAGGTGQFSKVTFQVNISDQQYRLGGFYLEMVNASTNIGAVDLKAGSSGKTPQAGESSMLDRVSDTADFIIDLGDPIILNEFDTVTFGSMVFTSDGDACPPGTGILQDDFRIVAYDKAHSRSTQSQSVTDLVAETDAKINPKDIGAPDIYSPYFSCCSGSLCV